MVVIHHFPGLYGYPTQACTSVTSAGLDLSRVMAIPPEASVGGLFMSYRAKGATPATAAVNREAEALYPMDDRHDFVDARQGLVAPIPNGQVLADDGGVIFDLADYAYLSDDAPAAGHGGP